MRSAATPPAFGAAFASAVTPIVAISRANSFASTSAPTALGAGGLGGFGGFGELSGAEPAGAGAGAEPAPAPVGTFVGTLARCNWEQQALMAAVERYWGVGAEEWSYERWGDGSWRSQVQLD